MCQTITRKTFYNRRTYNKIIETSIDHKYLECVNTVKVPTNIDQVKVDQDRSQRLLNSFKRVFVPFKRVFIIVVIVMFAVKLMTQEHH